MSNVVKLHTGPKAMLAEFRLGLRKFRPLMTEKELRARRSARKKAFIAARNALQADLEAAGCIVKRSRGGLPRWVITLPDGQRQCLREMCFLTNVESTRKLLAPLVEGLAA